MKTFRTMGYYNEEDAVYLQHQSADEVVSYMKNGLGAFHTMDCDELTEDELHDLNYQISTDGKYVVLYDVGKKNPEDNFIDIYKLEE